MHSHAHAPDGTPLYTLDAPCQLCPFTPLLWNLSLSTQTFSSPADVVWDKHRAMSIMTLWFWMLGLGVYAALQSSWRGRLPRYYYGAVPLSGLNFRLRVKMRTTTLTNPLDIHTGGTPRSQCEGKRIWWGGGVIRLLAGGGIWLLGVPMSAAPCCSEKFYTALKSLPWVQLWEAAVRRVP